VSKDLPTTLARYAAALAAVLIITYFYVHTHRFNVTTVAFTYLLAILGVSALWGLSVSVFMSLAATLAYNYFFLPPVGTLTIADPQNWVALFTFLATSILASDLSTRARNQAAEANRRRHEVERLYRFSQRLLSAGNPIELLNAIPRQIVEAFEVGAAALFLSDKQKVYRSGMNLPQLDADFLKAVIAREETQIDREHSVCFVPLRLGSRILGSLGISGPVLSRESLEAMGTLIAVAIERAHATEMVGKTEAAREGERLKSALLDAITHDFRTPLTSMKASVTTLLSPAKLDGGQRDELLHIIDEECDRLNRLVGEAAEMARLEAGEVKLHLEPVRADDLISGALDVCKGVLGTRPIRIDLKNQDLRVRADFTRAQEVLVHLVQNANLYSSPDLPITISAEEKDEFVQFSVADQGPGIGPGELGLIFDKFYRGTDQRYRVQGTGMGLPIAKAIVEAHGGTIGVISQVEHGSVFTFSLPILRGAAQQK
jgi:two-component system, OmpR family, sensor histidine kinase KdpD